MTRTLLALALLVVALSAFGCGGSGEEELHVRDAPTHQSADLDAEAEDTE